MTTLDSKSVGRRDGENSSRVGTSQLGGLRDAMDKSLSSLPEVFPQALVGKNGSVLNGIVANSLGSSSGVARDCCLGTV